MSQDHNTYENPLTGRYASAAMSYNWSAQKKHSTWRRMWIALAEAEHELGLPVTQAQIDEMKPHIDDIDFEAAAAKEKQLRHDVMSHIHIFGELCPNARPIIHLGATSCCITDNTELIQLRDGMKLIHASLLKVIAQLANFCREYRDMPQLGFTHYQPAQLVTVGKRFSLYLQDFLFDLQRLEFEMKNLPFRSVKGTTGTQASYLALFNGDQRKVAELEKKVAQKMGFEKVIAVTGQTYTRKIDHLIINVLAGIAASAYKLADDIRLLANLREIEEPFEKNQVGSSAMAYKRNPMRSERICSLARYLMSLPQNTLNTHATQWFERTLDDSANRRIVLAESFLTADVILSLLGNITSGFQVWPKVIERRVREEMPFMATENILMAAVKAGGDRQTLHEQIREHSMTAAKNIKEGRNNNLIELIKADPAFAAIKDRIDEIVNPSDFIGCAPEQVDAFLSHEVDPILAQYAAELQTATHSEINV